MKHLLIVVMLAVAPAPALAQSDSVAVQIGPGETCNQSDGPPLTCPGLSQRESSTCYRMPWSPLTGALTLGVGRRNFRSHRRL